jgi:hypothetical protein
MAKILIFFALFPLLHGETIKIDRLDQILPYINKATWVLLNIDDALTEGEREETCSLSIVNQIQQAAGSTCGLTARHPPLCPETLKQLAYIGIDLTFNAPFCPVLETQAPTRSEGGVLFLSDFSRKGDIFRKWLEISPIRPSKIVLIEKRGNNSIEMEKEMNDIGIDCTSVQLKALSEEN